jgi:hypothetical protein
MTFAEILELHPKPWGIDRSTMLRCIQECIDCLASCTACADACLGEEDLPSLVRCIRLDLDCADACASTERVLIRQTEPNTRLVWTTVEACAAACGACAEECERHAAHHEHCRLCAEVCRRCKAACEALLMALPPFQT